MEKNIKNETYPGYGSILCSIYTYKQFNTKGQLELTGQLKRINQDKRTGTWYYYNKQGELIQEENYKDGILIEKKKY